jgi:hypothetical protein
LTKLSKIITWAPVFLLIVIFSCTTFLLLSEWWNVEIMKEIDHYSWGPTNENSWFYETPSLYANVQLVKGLIMLLCTSITVIKIIKKDQNFKYWLFSSLIFFIIIFISSNIR